jgi:hypothetical protein
MEQMVTALIFKGRLDDNITVGLRLNMYCYTYVAVLQKNQMNNHNFVANDYCI